MSVRVENSVYLNFLLENGSFKSLIEFWRFRQLAGRAFRYNLFAKRQAAKRIFAAIPNVSFTLKFGFYFLFLHVLVIVRLALAKESEPPFCGAVAA